MHIRRVILKNIRNFAKLDRSFEDPWTGRVPEALLLTGPNGSGKTTLLEVIAALWQSFGEMLDEPYKISEQALGPLEKPDTLDAFMAMEVIGLEEIPLWIAISLEDTLPSFVANEVNSYRMCLLWSQSKSEFSRRILFPQGAYFDDILLLDHWAKRMRENRLGKRSDLPNLLHLPSETRTLPQVQESGPAQPEPREFHWIRRYSPTDRRRGSIENYLFNLKVLDDGRYDEIVRQVNQFLAGKRLDGFDERTLELMIATKEGDRHPAYLLSSGEKQILLMLAFITRWLEPGGIVLIDEPDLHLHVSLVRAFTAHLRRTIAQKNGQLFIASHEPALWEQFTQSQRVELGLAAEVQR